MLYSDPLGGQYGNDFLGSWNFQIKAVYLAVIWIPFPVAI